MRAHATAPATRNNLATLPRLLSLSRRKFMTYWDATLSVATCYFLHQSKTLLYSPGKVFEPMRPTNRIRTLLLATLLVAISVTSYAQISVGVSIRIGPPP